MVICHGTECVLEPEFPDVKSQFLSKATLQTAQFEPPENCPHIIKARKEGILPWAVGTIDFLNK